MADRQTYLLIFLTAMVLACMPHIGHAKIYSTENTGSAQYQTDPNVDGELKTHVLTEEAIEQARGLADIIVPLQPKDKKLGPPFAPWQQHPGALRR